MTLFERILSGEIPSYKIYEDDTTYAFLDISQATPGHTLVITREPYPDLLAADPEQLCHLTQVAQKIGKHLMEATGATGMNILSNVGESSGQTVPHVHIHLIPRYGQQDGVTIHAKGNPNLDLAHLAEKLRMD